MNFNDNKSNRMLLTDGKIYIDAAQKVKNLLINGSRVEAFNVDIKKYKDVKSFRLNGKTVFPGFIDSHVHPMTVASFTTGVSLAGCNDADSIAQKLKDYVKKNPYAEVIVGGGFIIDDYNKWSLNDLLKIDNATGSIPMLALDAWGHGMIVNTATLNICRISSNTHVPLSGKILMGNGMPTGVLKEAASTIAGNKLFQRIKDDLLKSELKTLLYKWASMGYTTLIDVMGGPCGRTMKPDLYMDLERNKELPVRINYMYTLFNSEEVNNALEYMNKNTELVRFGGLKLFVDGAFALGEAWTSFVNQQGNHGVYYVCADDTHGPEYNIKKIIKRADELGLNVHYHIQGDNAAEAVLESLDLIIKESGKLRSNHTLLHLAFLSDKQIKRISSFGSNIVTSVQPVFWELESDLSKYYGCAGKTTYPIKKIIDKGITTGISTDYWASPLDYCVPAKIMEVSMKGGGAPANHPPLTMKELIEALTIGSAASTNFKDIGTLNIGNKADFVVYEEDFYSIPVNELGNNSPQIHSTWVNGSKVFQA